LSKYGPSYRVSFAASIGLLAGAIASIGATWFLVRKRDKAAGEAVSLEREDGERTVEGPVPVSPASTSESGRIGKEVK